MKRLFLTLALGAMAVFGLNSCSDDDSEGGGEKRPYCEIEKFSVSVPNVEAKIDKDKAVVELYVAPDLLDLLSDVTPTGELSIGATVVPSFSVKQDFTKEVTYLVTAEDGKTQKTWTVKPVVSKYVAQGIGTVTRLWAKNATEIGLTVNEPTIASFEDKVIVSRPGMIINGNTGENTGEKINVDGIVCGAEANNIPFVVANDSKGNLLGATLGAWSRGASNPWKVYKWTALNAAPVEVLSYEQSATESFGRRLTAVGDVNGTAIVTSLNVDNYNLTQPSPAAAPAAHYCWTITNGVVNTKAELVAVPAGYRSGNMYQVLWPASELAAKPFYFSDPGASNAVPVTRLGYVGLDDQIVYFKGGVNPSDIMGGGDEMFKETGYGRKVLQSQPFTFNGVNYLAVCAFYSTEIGTNGATEDKVYLYTQLLEVSGKDYKVAYVGKDVFDGKVSTLNPNGTGGLAISVIAEGSGDDEGKLSCRVYNLLSGVGLVGYEINNVKE